MTATALTLLPALLPLACALAPAGAEDAPAAPAATTERVERRVAVMGTLLALSVEAGSRREALLASERALRAIETVEARLSTWRDDSELARLNAAPAGTPCALGPELEADLAAAARWWRETGGAFDPGIGSLVDAWGLRTGGRRPSPAELDAARADAGLAHLALEDGRAVRLRAGLRLEEGGFAKGVGLDAALAALEGTGATAAVLDLGGQLAVLPSSDPDAGRVAVAIADPRDRGRVLLELAVDAGSVATTGNSERGVVVDGERLGHVLDPRTGEPAPDFGSLTVQAADATAADCLSTGLYVLGPDGALAWAAARPGVEVVTIEIDARGTAHARATAGLRDRLQPLDTELTLDFEEPQEEARP